MMWFISMVWYWILKIMAIILAAAIACPLSAGILLLTALVCYFLYNLAGLIARFAYATYILRIKGQP